MTLSTLVTVLDKGTKMLFMITKFEASDDEILKSRGWLLSEELTIITEIGNKASSTILSEGVAKSSMSKFDFPVYDIKERSDKLGYSHTTDALARVVKNMNFDEIPDVIDVSDIKTIKH